MVCRILLQVYYTWGLGEYVNSSPASWYYGFILWTSLHIETQHVRLVVPDMNSCVTCSNKNWLLWILHSCRASQMTPIHLRELGELMDWNSYKEFSKDIEHNKRECVCHLCELWESRLSTNPSERIQAANLPPPFFNICSRYVKWDISSLIIILLLWQHTHNPPIRLLHGTRDFTKPIIIIDWLNCPKVSWLDWQYPKLNQWTMNIVKCGQYGSPFRS